MIAGDRAPSLIIVDDSIDIPAELPLPAYAAGLREQSPESRIVVVINRLDSLSSDDVLRLFWLPTEGQLLRSMMTPEKLQHIVLGVLKVRITVWDRPVQRLFAKALQRQFSWSSDDPDEPDPDDPLGWPSDGADDPDPDGPH